MSPAADSVESFLQLVADQLPGSNKDCAAILAELHDGLLEATESHQGTAPDRAQAVRLANASSATRALGRIIPARAHHHARAAKRISAPQ